AEASGAEAAEIEPAHVEVQWGDDAHGPDLAVPSPAESGAMEDGDVAPTPQARGAENTPASLAAARAAEAVASKIDTTAYDCIRDIATLREWIAEAREAGVVAFDAETNSLDPMQAELCGFSLATRPGRAAYVPLIHKAGAGDLLGGGLVEGQIPVREALAVLKGLLEDPATLKIVHNLKYDMLLMMQHGIDIRSYDDTLLMSYVCDAANSLATHGMDAL